LESNKTATMIIAAAREIRDNDIIFVGIGMPMLASLLAKKMQAPNIRMLYEGGNVDCRPENMPIHIADLNLVPGAAYAGGFDVTMGSYLQRGKVDVAFLGGAQIDKYGNLNTTVIGDYYHPAIRLPGSGGGNPLGSLAKRTIILMRFGAKRFVEHLDYLTTPGYLQGACSRAAAGLPPGGPTCVICDAGIFRFDDETKEMYLDRIMPGCDLDYIKSMVGWDLKISDNLKFIDPIGEEAWSILQQLDPKKVYL